MKPTYSTAAAAGGVTGALAVIIIWLFSLMHVDVPAEVVAALMVLGTPVVHWLGVLMNKVAPEAAAPGDTIAKAPVAAMLLILLLPVLMLSACANQVPVVATTPATAAATTAAPAPIDPLVQIAAFTAADLAAAQLDATANNDAIAAACYPALSKFVASMQGKVGNVATVQGAFTAFQRARDVRYSVQGGLPDYLRLGCAALVQDEKLLIAKLAAIGAGTAAATVVAPMAPALLAAP